MKPADIIVSDVLRALEGLTNQFERPDLSLEDRLEILRRCADVVHVKTQLIQRLQREQRDRDYHGPRGVR